MSSCTTMQAHETSKIDDEPPKAMTIMAVSKGE